MPQTSGRANAPTPRSGGSGREVGDKSLALRPAPPAPGRLQAARANPWLRRAVGVLGFALLTLSLLEFPRYPYHPSSHDLSSHATFEYYAAKQFQFGQQVYQNVGPYGYVHYACVYAGYLPVRKVVLKNCCRLGLVLLIVWLGRRLGHPGLKLCWWASFFIFLPLNFQGWPPDSPLSVVPLDFWELDWDQVYGCLTIYLAALYLLQSRRDGWFWAASGGLLPLLAFLALTKHTLFILAAFAAFAVGLQKLVRKDLWQALLAPGLFALFVVIFWVLARQELGNLPGFARGILTFATGYNEAMMNEAGLGVTLLALGIFGLLLGRSLYNWLALRQGIGRLLFEAALLFVAWKHSLVRADALHAPLFALLAWLLVLPFFFVRLPARGEGLAISAPSIRPDPVATWAIVPVAGLAILLLAHFGDCRSAGKERFDCLHYRPGDLWRRLQSNAAWVFTPGRRLDRMERSLERVRAAFSLTTMKATIGNAKVDFFGYSPGHVLISDLNYWSRPMPISFAASNELLARANEAFFRTPATAPEYVVCGLYSGLGDRAGMQDDAPALQALLDNYHPLFPERGLLLLQKNTQNWREWAERKPLVAFDTRFGVEFPLREWSSQMVWMEVNIKHSLLGKLWSFLYRPPPCYIAYRCVGENSSVLRRFVTSMGSSGCLLSPLLQDDGDLLALYRAGDSLDRLKRIESFWFICQPGDRLFFQKDIRVRLYSVGRPSERPAAESHQQ